MDITQPDPAQHQPDDLSGGDEAESSSPNQATEPAAQQPDRPQRFAEVLAEVDEVDGRPLAEHNDVFTRAHRELTDALNDVERGDS